jgi:hypothetical protein
MKTRIVCLANSYKEGGRCIAGIELNKNNELPHDLKWIRPICDTLHGELPTMLVQHIKPLDILKFKIIANASEGFQSENVLFDKKSLKRIGTFDNSRLPDLCFSHPPLLFGSKGKAISEEGIGQLDHSLILISTPVFEIIERNYEEKSNSQTRIKFDYNSNEYDLPVTDPLFLDKYKNNKHVLSGIPLLYLVVSLGILHEGWHYKLVACILY